MPRKKAKRPESHDVPPGFDPYVVLGLDPTATTLEIKTRYRYLVLICHPDKDGGDVQRFKDVKLAHDILSDPAKRKYYANSSNRGSKVELDFSGAGAKSGQSDILSTVVAAMKIFMNAIDNQGWSEFWKWVARIMVVIGGGAATLYLGDARSD